MCGQISVCNLACLEAASPNANPPRVERFLKILIPSRLNFFQTEEGWWITRRITKTSLHSVKLCMKLQIQLLDGFIFFANVTHLSRLDGKHVLRPQLKVRPGHQPFRRAVLPGSLGQVEQDAFPSSTPRRRRDSSIPTSGVFKADLLLLLLLR